MRILFVVDGRSPIAMNWIAYFVNQGHEVHLASSFEFDSNLEFSTVEHIPIGFSQLKGKDAQGKKGSKVKEILWNSQYVNLRTGLRRVVAPLTISPASRKLARVISEIQPDLVHAMRIPFEGILASKALENFRQIPLVISVWGNDFTLHGNATQWMRNSTKKVLTMVSGLHTDCRRDQELAFDWGFDRVVPTLVIPGNGGIDTSVFFPSTHQSTADEVRVINPRGIRAYIRNDTFFKSIPRIIEQIPGTSFICPGMLGMEEATKWLDLLGIRDYVKLLPSISRQEMSEYFRQSAITVSPSTHDGTPNSLLEGMACGSFPVVGDLDSIREWIEPGKNGFLIDPGDPDQLAQAVIDAIRNKDLRDRAAKINVAIVNEKAEYYCSMRLAEKFYLQVLGEKDRERS